MEQNGLVHFPSSTFKVHEAMINLAHTKNGNCRLNIYDHLPAEPITLPYCILILNLAPEYSGCVSEPINTVLCPIKVNSNTIELPVHTSCQCVKTYSVLLLIPLKSLMFFQNI